MTNRRGARDLRRAEGGARAADRGGRRPGRPDARRGARGRLPGRRPARASAHDVVALSGSGLIPGASIRPRTRSPPAPGPTTSASRPSTTPTTSTRSSPPCTSTGTASTSIRSIQRSSARRSGRGCRSDCTSRRAACGRTSSGAAGRSGVGSTRSCRRRSRSALGGVELERFYRAVNRVHPSLIRIHADEVTYNLHVILRFELEQDIVNGRVELRDLPVAWNAKMHEYLGIEVPSDAEGVLQDMHWSGGRLGYFSDVLARQRDVAPDLGAGARGHSRSSRAVRAGRVRRAPLLARRAPAPVRAQVLAEGDARAASRAGRSTRGRICATSRRSTEPPRQRDPSGHVQGQTLDRSGKDPFNISAPPLHGQSCANSHSPARTGLSKT